MMTEIVDEKELERLRKVPDWLKNKIDKRYVVSKVEKGENGFVHLVITVGGRETVNLTAKDHPETEEEWTAISDILELNHYINWMRRFYEELSHIEDERTREALSRSEMPSDGKNEENGVKRSRDGRLCRVRSVICSILDSVLFPDRWWEYVATGVVMTVAFVAVNMIMRRIGIQ